MHRRTMLDPDLLPGDLKLLHALATLDLALDPDRIPARRRLERRLGVNLARSLCAPGTEPRARAA